MYSKVANKTLFMLSLVVLLWACKSNRKSELVVAPHPSIDFKTPINLKIGTKVDWKPASESTKHSLTFVGVRKDERCPIGDECFWEGEAIVDFLLKTDETIPFQLSTYEKSIEASNRIDTMGYRITILQLTPYPLARQPLDSSRYNVKFLLSKP